MLFSLFFRIIDFNLLQNYKKIQFILKNNLYINFIQYLMKKKNVPFYRKSIYNLPKKSDNYVLFSKLLEI